MIKPYYHARKKTF